MNEQEISNQNKYKQVLLRELMEKIPIYGNKCYHCSGPLEMIYERRCYPMGELLFCSGECFKDWKFDLYRRHPYLLSPPSEYILK